MGRKRLDGLGEPLDKVFRPTSGRLAGDRVYETEHLSWCDAWLGSLRFHESQNSEVGRRKHIQAVGGTSSVVLALVAALSLRTKSPGRGQSRAPSPVPAYTILPTSTIFLHRHQLTTLVRLNKLRQNER